MNIYISHPYGGNKKNKDKIEDIIKELVKEDPSHTYISPVHCFGFMYNDFSYEQGLEMCLNLLEMCDKMYVFGKWKDSRGCTAEVLFAEQKGIPFDIRHRE